MSKSQSSNVDGRCDGAEISLRDQRVGTSHSDRVREDVSLEYVMLSQQTYIPLTYCVREAMSWVGKVDNTASVSVG